MTKFKPGQLVLILDDPDPSIFDIGVTVEKSDELGQITHIHSSNFRTPGSAPKLYSVLVEDLATNISVAMKLHENRSNR